ncbi:MAG: flagellin lysine-N-methylase [Lachnospiraceae bacterium]|nr:flagellin lysine-N-methylase [Lachnospiraceae bacterium]
MKYIKPDFYDTFKCTAGDCPDSCCKGWQIMIDDESFDKYLKLGGDFGKRMTASLDFEQQSFLQFGGRCAFLNEDHLCDLIKEKGEDYLCHTCSRYPRHVEEFEGLREYSLSLSCPEAAGIILGQRGPLNLVCTEDEETEPLADDFEEFDTGMFAVLEEARDLLFAILAFQGYTVKEKLIAVLLVVSQIQWYVDEGRCLEIYELIDAYKEKGNNLREMLATAEKVLQENTLYQLLTGNSEEYRDAVTEGMEQLERLERLRDDWEEVLKEAQGIIKGQNATYAWVSLAFEEAMVKNVVFGEEMERWQINLAYFFLYTYFCGAVYDDCVYSKGALAVFSVCFLKEFVMCRWFLADKYIEMEECVKLSYRYAREVEHSDDNLIMLEEWLMEGYIPVKGAE